MCIRDRFIEYTSGDAYTKKVLSLQSYDSKTIPFQRGNIVDSNGTVLATVSYTHLDVYKRQE